MCHDSGKLLNTTVFLVFLTTSIIFMGVPEVSILQKNFKNTNFLAERHSFGRITLFRQKGSLAADRRSFGSIGISAEIAFEEVLSFGFLQKERISLSVAH